MRKILFRGKRKEDNNWIEGYYYFGVVGETAARMLRDKEHFVLDGDRGLYYAVHPKTVGQYTGLKDKEGNRIFEGDIVSHEGTAYKVFFDKEDAGFYLKYFAGVVRGIYDGVVVIGNTTDNPELLRGIE